MENILCTLSFNWKENKRSIYKPIYNIIRYFFLVAFYALGIYIASVNLSSLGDGLILKIRLSYVFIKVLSLYLCFLLHNKVKEVYRLVNQLEQHLCNMRNSSNQGGILSKCVPFYLLSLPFGLGTLLTVANYMENRSSAHYSYGYVITNQPLRYALICLYSVSDMTFILSYPCLAAFGICSVLFRCGHAIFQYRKTLKYTRRRNISSDAVYVLKEYFVIMELLEKIGSDMSQPLLILFTSIVFNLFTNLSFWLVLDIGSSLWRRIVNVVTFATTLGSLIAISFASESVVNTLIEIRWDAASWLDELRISDFRNTEVVFLLERIEKADIAYISAAGFVKIDRRLIVSTLGVLLSYGLLIISISNKN